jgi:hypothetical protein
VLAGFTGSASAGAATPTGKAAAQAGAHTKSHLLHFLTLSYLRSFGIVYNYLRCKLSVSKVSPVWVQQRNHRNTIPTLENTIPT